MFLTDGQDLCDYLDCGLSGQEETIERRRLPFVRTVKVPDDAVLD